MSVKSTSGPNLFSQAAPAPFLKNSAFIVMREPDGIVYYKRTLRGPMALLASKSGFATDPQELKL